YAPSAADIAAGGVTLTLTPNDPAGHCPAVSVPTQLTINPAATANPQGPYVMCSSDANVQLHGLVGGGATTGNWSSSGTGTFTPGAPNTGLNPTYAPSAADIAAGGVTLTLTTNDPSGPCPAVSVPTQLTINPAATANPQGPYSMCLPDANLLLHGLVGGGATTGNWSTSGTGTFTPGAPNTGLNPTYTPSAADIAAGSVTLTLTTNDPAGPCPAVSVPTT